MIPEDICISNCLLAFSKSGKRINVAVKGSMERNIIDEIRLITGKEPILYLGQESQIFAAIHKFFSRVNVKSALTNLKNEYETQPEKPQLIREKIRHSENSPIVSLSRSIIIRAICMEASDIHIEPCADYVKVRFRIDGMLYEYMKMPKEIYPMVCARIKVLAGIDVTEKRKPQDGKIVFSYSGSDYDFRLATIPTFYGEKIVIRILNNTRNKTSLPELGFDKTGIKVIGEMLDYPYGMILVSGPTGSGKSTTIYSMLNSMNKLKKNIMTIEDPVEYSIEGVNQVNVCSKTGITFSSGLRSVLRQDPDVIMIGEIRDEETARTAVRAAITGHLVLSTLHTNDSTSSAIRLVDMGVPAYLASDAMVGIIAQRLVRKICVFCREEILPDEETSKIMDLDAKEKIYMGKGCAKCNYTGYKGRTVVYECNKIDAEKKMIIQNSKTVEEMRRRNFEAGMNTLKENCLKLVRSGVTTFEEYKRITADQ